MKDYLYIPQVCCSYKPPVPATHITRGRNTPRSQGHKLGEFKEKGKTKKCVQKELDVNATEDTHKGRFLLQSLLWKCEGLRPLCPSTLFKSIYFLFQAAIFNHNSEKGQTPTECLTAAPRQAEPRRHLLWQECGDTQLCRSELPCFLHGAGFNKVHFYSAQWAQRGSIQPPGMPSAVHYSSSSWTTFNSSSTHESITGKTMVTHWCLFSPLLRGLPGKKLHSAIVPLTKPVLEAPWPLGSSAPMFQSSFLLEKKKEISCLISSPFIFHVQKGLWLHDLKGKNQIQTTFSLCCVCTVAPREVWAQKGSWAGYY